MTEEEIFEAVVQQPSQTERAAFLDGACAGDVELRRRVESLVRSHEGAGSFLVSPPLGVAATAAFRPLTEQPGMSIGHYKLLQKIGEGGMGVVYMAEQLLPVRRKVALKIIKPGMDSAQVVARFEAERQALALMDHQHIARVLDAGTTDSGRPYFVMELVHGVPITEYCDANHLPPRERLELLVPVCQAIQHAHQKGIIHRDIKPSNVMVCLYDGKAVPKIIDFGIAKATEQRLTERTMFTQYGAIVGTFEYMSPEQAEMSQLGIDTRSDIYSLGVLLYELLTGGTPLEKQRLREAAFDEVLRMIREEEAPMMSTRLGGSGAALAAISSQRRMEPARLTKLLRGELDWIVMKALEKDRTRRYDSASGLARDIERYLSDEPVEACPPSLTYWMGKFARKNRALLSSAAALAAVLLLGAFVSTWQAIRASHAEAEAKTQRDAANLAKVATEQKRNALFDANQKLERVTDDLRRSLYSTHIALAEREYHANNLGRARDLLDTCPDELRHWEWHYLHRLCHAELLTLPHSGMVVCVAFSPDGRRLASGGGYSEVDASGELKIWDADTGKELFNLTGHAQPVSCIAFSPDGQRLVSASSDKTIKFWNASTGKELNTVSVPTAVIQLVFNPDGQSLATAFAYPDGGLKIWDAMTGKEIPTPYLCKVMGAIAFRPDGEQLAVVTGPDNIVKLYDVATGEEHPVTFSRHEGLIGNVAFSRDGRQLAAASVTRLSISDAKTGEEIRTIQGAGFHAGNVAFSSEWQRVAVACTDHSIQLWDAATGKKMFALRGHTGLVGPADMKRALVFSPDGSRLASASVDKTVKVWDATRNPEARVWHEAKCRCVAFNRRGDLLAVGKGADNVNFKLQAMGEVRLVDLKTGKSGKSLGSTLQVYSSVAFSPDDEQIAGVTAAGLKIWDLQTQKEVLSFAADFGGRPSLAFSPDRKNQHLAVAGGGSVRIWDAASSKLIHSLPGPDGSVAFDHDGQLLAAGSKEEGKPGVVKVWDATTGEEIRTWLAHDNAVVAIAFSLTTGQLASGSLDRFVKIWDVVKGTEIRALGPHPEGVISIAFSPDGRRLAVGGGGDLVKLWDAESGEDVTLHQPTDEVPYRAIYGLAFSPDGRQIAAADLFGHVILWDAAPIQGVR